MPETATAGRISFLFLLIVRYHLVQLRELTALFSGFFAHSCAGAAY
jgi:hypothetical protein